MYKKYRKERATAIVDTIVCNLRSICAGPERGVRLAHRCGTRRTGMGLSARVAPPRACERGPRGIDEAHDLARHRARRLQDRGDILGRRRVVFEHRHPVVVELALEQVTNVAMDTETDRINEFEDIDCRHPDGRQGLEVVGLLA